MTKIYTFCSHCCIYSFIHTFILETYIAPLQETTTQRRSQPSHGQKRRINLFRLSRCQTFFISLVIYLGKFNIVFILFIFFCVMCSEYEVCMTQKSIYIWHLICHFRVSQWPSICHWKCKSLLSVQQLIAVFKKSCLNTEITCMPTYIHM